MLSCAERNCHGDIGESPLASRSRLLSWLSSLRTFAGARALHHILTSVPQAFKLAQGDFDYGGCFDSDNAVLVTAASAARQLLDLLTEFKKPETRDLLVTSVDAELLAQLDLVCARSLTYGELTEAEAVAFRGSFDRLRKEALDDVKAALADAVKAVEEAQGTVKLREALAGLELRENFNVNVAPLPLPVIPAGVFAFFGVPHEKQTLSLYTALRSQWAAHCKAWKAPAPGTVFSNSAVYSYWAQLYSVSPELSSIACIQWLRPVNSASVERIYSILTHMDTPTRRSMGRKLLHDLLFISGNAHLVGVLLHDFAERVRVQQESAVRLASHKRRAEDEARVTDGTARAVKKLHNTAGAAGAAGGAAAGAVPRLPSVPFSQFSVPRGSAMADESEGARIDVESGGPDGPDGAGAAPK
jgi:hypothetical protein